MIGLDRTLSFVLVGALGAAVGSWLNVIILRLQSDRPWWRGRSACPHCGRPLRWFELVPIASYLWLRGRCRSCRRGLSKQYLIVELLTAVGFSLTWWVWPSGWSLLAAWAVVGTMILVGVYDARWSLIPDSFSLALLAAAVLVVLLSRSAWLAAAIGGLAGTLFFTAQYLLSRRRWVGSGDILLGLSLGLLLGWRLLTLALFLAYLSGAVVAVGLILARRLRLSSTMPFGPYLLASGFTAWLWGGQIIDWYFRHAL